MKLCSKCGNPGKFYKDRTKKDGLHSICASCHKSNYKSLIERDSVAHEKRKARSKKWRNDNPERSRTAITNATLKAKYNITLDDYNEMLENQNGCCKICKDTPTYQRLHVDHCHTTGKVRGLLCQACNVSIGKMKESPELLRKLADYIEENQN